MDGPKFVGRPPLPSDFAWDHIVLEAVRENAPPGALPASGSIDWERALCDPRLAELHDRAVRLRYAEFMERLEDSIEACNGAHFFIGLDDWRAIAEERAGADGSDV
jgi:hypothetical protein